MSRAVTPPSYFLATKLFLESVQPIPLDAIITLY